MKKKVWLLGVAVAALTSCTENEVLEIPESRVIGFESFVEKQTRATTSTTEASDYETLTNDILSADLTTFYTYGSYSDKDYTSNSVTSVFANTAMHKINANGDFGYSSPVSWMMDKRYHFAAYTNANEQLANDKVSFFFRDTKNIQNGENETTGEITTGSAANVWGLTITDYEVGGKDLLASVPREYETVSNKGTQVPVNMTFRHLLSKVKFRFSYAKTAALADHDMRIKEIKFKGIKKADCTVIHHATYATYIDWDSQFKTFASLAEGKKVTHGGDYTFFSGDKTIIQNSESELTNNYIVEEQYVIPQKNSITIDEIVVETYETLHPSNVTAVNVFTNVSLVIPGHEYWKPGYVYRYVASLTPDKQTIEFVGSVINWDDPDDRDGVIESTTPVDEGA